MSEQASIVDVVNAVASAIESSTDVWFTQRPDQMMDGVFDLPVVWVYPDSGRANMSRTHSHTFTGQSQVSTCVVNIDVIADQRNFPFENVPEMVEMIDNINSKLGAIETKPYFGLDTIQAFNWSWEKMVWEVEGDPLLYIGVRFIVELVLEGKIT